MAGNIKVGGNTIFTHTGAVGAGTVTLKDQSGNTILTDNGTAVSMGNLRLPSTGGIKDSSGNNILTESGGVVSAGPSLALGTTSNPLTKNIVMGSGYGLDFSAAAGSAAGSSSALLDDYEEGTFTPVFSNNNAGASYSSQSGKYIKVGKIVLCNISIRSTGISGTGTVYLSLPFASDGYNGGAFSFNDCGHTLNISNTSLNPRMRHHGAATLQGTKTLGNTTYLTYNELTSGSLQFDATFVYKAS